MCWLGNCSGEWHAVPVSAADVLHRLSFLIDEHRWSDLAPLLHPDFCGRLVHTGETFDRESWIRFNAEYPGFQRFELLDVVAEPDRAAGRAHVTGLADGATQHFEVASFLTTQDGLVIELVEVWTEVDQLPSPGTRPD